MIEDEVFDSICALITEHHASMINGPYKDPILVWRHPDGSPISCQEKLKVLEENLSEVRQVCQDTFEDALLMGCDEAQVRAVLRAIVDQLVNPLKGG